MCRVDDGCMAMMLASEQRKARKQHRCDECRRTIEAGETYLHERGIHECEPFTNKTCAHCQVARGWLSDQCGGWIYTEVEEELREHFYEDTAYRTKDLKRLIYGMGRQWHLRRGGLMPLPRLSQTESPSP